MNDFIKIFLVLCGVVASFLFGRSFGEKTFKETPDYRSVVQSNEELNFARNDLENIKIKLQNITDTAGNKKTDELLSQIFQIFETDMGLKIQNKDQIVQKATDVAKTAEEKTTALAAAEAKLKSAAAVNEDKKEEAQETEKSVVRTAKNWTRTNLNKFKSYEWMVTNSSGNTSTLSDLKKVQIRNIASFLKDAEIADTQCESFYGSYKGSVRDIDNRYFGSMEFELKRNEDNENLAGKVAWYNNDQAFSEILRNDCGKKVDGLSGRVFSISADKYVQIYKLNNFDKTAGNFYEVLPNGTTKIIGSFVLNRVDKF